MYVSEKYSFGWSVRVRSFARLNIVVPFNFTADSVTPELSMNTVMDELTGFVQVAVVAGKVKDITASLLLNDPPPLMVVTVFVTKG